MRCLAELPAVEGQQPLIRNLLLVYFLNRSKELCNKLPTKQVIQPKLSQVKIKVISYPRQLHHLIMVYKEDMHKFKQHLYFLWKISCRK